MPILFSKIEGAKDYILTGFLLVIATALLVTRHDGGMNTTRVLAITTMSYLEQPLSSIRIYRKALQTNVELHRENVLLLDELSRLRSANEEIETLRSMLEFKSTYSGTGELIAVRVVGKNITGYRNTITINAGQRQGVIVGMPVVNANGLVGRVVLSAADYAQIMPMQNSLFRTSASVQGLRAYGILSWVGSGDGLVLKYVPKTIEVPIGSIVETSSFSNQFPANIPIGTVSRTEPEPGLDTQLIYVNPFTDLNRIAEAFVLKFNPITEIDSLKTEFEGMY
jgi:rod shape-determining protein MreC